MTNQALLHIKNLSLAYGHNEVLHAVDLALYPNEIVGLVGGSGGGKSTLLKAVTGLLPTNAHVISGNIFWQDCDLLNSDAKFTDNLLGRDISLLFQDPTASLYPSQTIGMQICTMLQAQKSFAPAEILQRAAEVLQTLGFSEPQTILASYPFQLSGGMNQRVCIAMALLLNVALLLADEPTAGLDVLTQQTILRQLQTFRETSQAALLIISHNIGALAQIADKLVVMDQGRIIEAGPAAAILDQPQQAYTQKLIQALPHFRKDFSL